MNSADIRNLIDTEAAKGIAWMTNRGAGKDADAAFAKGYEMGMKDIVARLRERGALAEGA